MLLGCYNLKKNKMKKTDKLLELWYYKRVYIKVYPV